MEYFIAAIDSAGKLASSPASRRLAMKMNSSRIHVDLEIAAQTNH